jgi:hypothetical protein
MAASMEMEHWMRTVYYYNLNDCDKLPRASRIKDQTGAYPTKKVHESRVLVM